MSALPLLARLGEAASFPKAVRAYESDPWGYMRRKLESCEPPLRDYKQELLEDAKVRLKTALKAPLLQPGELLDFKETFEKLLTAADFADLSFHLTPGEDPETRREAVTSILSVAHLKTGFDVEELPAERRGKPWETLVAEMGRRLELEKLKTMLDRKPKTERRRAAAMKLLRRALGEFLAVTRGEAGMRDDITLFVLVRVEAVIATTMRFLKSPQPTA